MHPKEVQLRTFTVDGSAELGGPQWLRDRRAAGMGAFASSSMPSESEEVWRYTPIDELDLDEFVPVTAVPGAPPEAAVVLSDAVASVLGPLSGRVLVHNGYPHSFDVAGGSPVSFGGSDDVAGGSTMVGSVQVGGDALVLLNDAYLPDPVLVDVPAGVVLPDPILVVHWCAGDEAAVAGTAIFPRTSVRLGGGARAGLVEVYAGPASARRTLVAPVTELQAGAEASLSYVSLQILGDSAWFIARLAASGDTDSVLRTFTVGLGGDYDRVRADVSVVGRGARSEILSTYLGTGTQVHDIRTLQDHVAPRTNSELLCQGAVAGTSRSVYSGLIRVHRGAVRSDARQTNHNLVLDEGAHADSVPNLDILENDVKCSHASTVGPIEEDQRYYIESRGVSPEVAEGLIVEGFFNDIIDRGPLPAVTPLLTREVHTRLDVAFGHRRETLWWPVPETVVLCRTDELSSGQARRFDVAGQRIALVRTDDEFHAVGDRCSHENYSLADGEVWVEEREIECPRHGSTFDLRTGSPCSLPATQPVARYEVAVIEGNVCVVLP